MSLTSPPQPTSLSNSSFIDEPPLSRPTPSPPPPPLNNILIPPRSPGILERRTSGVKSPMDVPQDTLAIRRFKSRPTVVRRRSRSLDDDLRASEDGVDDVEGGGGGGGKGTTINGPSHILATPFRTKQTVQTPNSTSPLTASSSTSTITIPTSSVFTSTSFATTAPSPYASSPISPLLGNGRATGGGGAPSLGLATRCASMPEPTPPTSTSTTTTGEEHVLDTTAFPAFGNGSKSMSRSVSESGATAVHKSLRRGSTRPTNGTTPSKVDSSTSLASLISSTSTAKPFVHDPPPRSSHAPNLPSPLSTSYVSELTVGGSWKSPVTPTPLGEFPFPPSPSKPTFSSLDDLNSPHHPAPPLSTSTSSRTITTTSPFIPSSTSSGTFTPPLSSPPIPAIPRRLQSPTPLLERNRSKSGGAHTGTLESPNRSNFPTAPPPPPPAHVGAGGHWRSASASFSQGGITAPSLLTPPESNGTETRQLSSATHLAWNDVLGGMGSLTTTFGGAGQSSSGGGGGHENVGGGGGGGGGGVVDDLMALEGETPLLGRAMPMGGSRSATPTESFKRVGNEDLMAGQSGGHYGPVARERLAQLIDELIEEVPLSVEDEVLSIVEYSALNSRSAVLVPPMISHFATRHDTLLLSSSTPITDSNSLSFQITHADKSLDFRPLASSLNGDSYLSPHWLASHDRPLEGRVFSSLVSRPFGAKVVPRGSVSLGFSAMALHWLSTDRRRLPAANLAHGELMAFLSARANEFKPGGLLVMAYIGRSEPVASTPSTTRPSPTSSTTTNATRPTIQATNSSPGPSNSVPLPILDDLSRPLSRERSSSTPVVPTLANGGRKRDIWDVLSGILGKAIQRLVSTQLLKPAVARALLALPIHPRTPKQTQAVLRANQHSWKIERDEMIVLSHPAWLGLQHGTVSNASYADHTIQLLRIFWEAELRTLLREALSSRAACEWILECLWTVAKEKVTEEGPQPLDMEVQVVALRRRNAADGETSV